jgi:RND superfamily putative drug exporter
MLVLPLLVFVGWLVLAAVTGPFAGRLAEVQENDQSSFLPAEAESAQAQELAAGFTDRQSFPAFIVVESDDTLTPQDLEAIQAFVAEIPGIEIPVAGSDPVPVGDYLTAPQVPVVPAEDGKAALALVNFDAAEIGASFVDGESPIERAVEEIRAAAPELEQQIGAVVYVAGPGGQLADLVTAFGGIDGVLLGVALSAVLIILLVVYRSPVVPFLVIFTAVFALGLASAIIYLLADNDVLTLDGQSQGILSILVVGAATDYSLLLVARYREELLRHDDRFGAMRLAWRRTLEPVVASAGTVILALLCLLLADLGPTRGLGPVGAIGIAAAVLSALTFLPAVLVLPGRTTSGQHGRWIFWPRIPHLGGRGPEQQGIWAAVARVVGAHPRRVWALTGLGLLALAAFLPTFPAEGVKQSDLFLDTVESVQGDEALARHFPGGSGAPTTVIGPADKVADLQRVAQETPGVAAVQPLAATPPGQPPQPGVPVKPLLVDGRAQLDVTLSDPADSPAADRTVELLRERLDTVSEGAVVGGTTAINLDVRTIAANDRNTIIPVVLGVIFVVLALLLRALVAPLVLLLANVLSFAATLGASALVFNHVVGFPGGDPSIPLYGFVFLVALGIDYSIFLMTRVREESVRHGTRPGILIGLAVTGGVITSAGVVLASTFASLSVIPILFLAQMAFIVAFGVLLDTLVVRSLLVPSISYDIGRRTWWPSRLSTRRSDERARSTGG